MNKDELKRRIDQLKQAIANGLQAIEQLKTQVAVARGKMDAYIEMLEEKSEADGESQVEE